METTSRRALREFKIAMMDAHVTQMDMSRVSGIPQPNISTILSGHRPATPQQLDRLYDAFEMVMETNTKRKEEVRGRVTQLRLTQL
jgi:plasmid maintenance system antidote protein VapI